MMANLILFIVGKLTHFLSCLQLYQTAALPVTAHPNIYSQYCASSPRWSTMVDLPYHMVRGKLFQLSTHGKPYSSNTIIPSNINSFLNTASLVIEAKCFLVWGQRGDSFFFSFPTNTRNAKIPDYHENAC